MTIKVEQGDGDATSPTTPTPTKTAFGQRPLPTSPFLQAVQIPEGTTEDKTPQRSSSKRSRASRADSEDITMDDSSEEDGHGKEEHPISEGESVNADGSKSNKKKKSQRFYCTEYPPCKLSFTRSEHLARHIRKHTGERPFRCHCSRRFSRLDNLRQHAQTVHVNEEIPHDSPAASNTRFQRQGRPDRARQPGRARASTAGSLGAPARGHSKSLSTSSISSMGSNFSTIEDMRPRPPSLIMADPRYQYSSEAYPPPQPSPSDFSTPTSATFSAGQSSPRWNPAMTSPPSSHSRTHSLYVTSQIPTRRLSVPSSGIPFQFQHGATPGRPVFDRLSPGVPGGSHPSPYSPASSTVASPTSSVFSRRESTAGADEWRRRTWHPDTINLNHHPPGSRLSHLMNSQYPSPPHNHVNLPAQRQHQQSDVPLRLPGIESFGPLPHRPAPLARNQAAPMMVERDLSHPSALRPSANPAEMEEKRSTANWDMGLHRGLTRLDITSKPTTSDSAGSWAHEANQAMDMETHRVRANPPAVRFDDSAMPDRLAKPAAPPGYHQYTMSAPSVASSRDSKRRPWYQSGMSTYSDAPPDRSARLNRMIHPNLGGFRGFSTREIPPSGPALDPALGPTPREEDPEERGTVRLDALVAAATGERNTGQRNAGRPF